VAVFGGCLLAGWAFADPAAFAAPGQAAAAISPAPSAPTDPPAATDPAGPLSTAAPAGSTAPSGPTPTAVPGASPPPGAPTLVPLPGASAAPPVSPALAGRLDRTLARAAQVFLLPGVAATVIFADGSTWTGVAGLADAAAARPVTPATPFAVASVSKTFTAALVLRYVDEGLVGLDDPLSRYLPTWPKASTVTIRELLQHTSGIPDFFANPTFEKALDRRRARAWTADEVLARFVPPGRVFAPGTGWAYSNTNYVLLGQVAERVGGAPWAALVRRELLDPLGLSATTVQIAEPPSAAPARAYRMVLGAGGKAVPQPLGDGTDVVPFTSVVSAAGSAGAIASTTGDLARWARVLYGGGILSQATRREMLTFVRASSYGAITAYGLGVSRVRFQGRYAYGHTGALAGSRAAIRYFPKDRITIAVAFNRETFSGDVVVERLAKAIFPDPTPAPSPSAGITPPAP